MTSRKQMAMNGAAPFLPEEIITNILKRLPVKSLIRFRCVCQHWKNLIKNPSFITDHLRHSAHQNPYFLFFHTYTYGLDNPLQLNLLDSETQVRDLQKAPPFDSLQDKLVNIIGSSNGLLCVTIQEHKHSRSPPSVLLWNPATKDVREVPTSTTIGSRVFDRMLGFGFSSSLNDYKIVAITGNKDYRVEVYSLNRDSWKEIEIVSFPEYFRFFGDIAVSSNEAIFWKGLRSREGVIVSFDIAKEVFTFISWPPIASVEASLFINNLTVYNDKLAIFDGGSDGSSFVDLWLMEEDIVSSREIWNWTKTFTGGPYPLVMFNCVGAIWRHEIVMVGRTAELRRLCLANLTSNEFKMLDFPEFCPPTVFLNYVESLVPVFNIHNIEEP